jgi:hypothetical protein
VPPRDAILAFGMEAVESIADALTYIAQCKRSGLADGCLPRRTIETIYDIDEEGTSLKQ